MGINYLVSTSVVLYSTKRIERHMFIRILDVCQLARRALAVGAAAVAVSGCNSAAGPQSPPPTEVSVMEVKTGPVTVYNEYVAQTQAPDAIEIRAQVTGLLERQLFADGARVRKGDVLYVVDQRPFESQLAQAKAGLAQAQANLVNAQQNLARNSRLTAQQTLLNTLYSSDPMWVYLTISEERLLQLQKAVQRPDQKTPFHIRLADGTDYAFTGRLSFVDAAMDQKSGTLQVRVSVPNPDRLLLPGLVVRVSVAAFESPSAIRIPQQAVQELQGLKSVYVVAAGDKAEPRQIVANYRLGNDWVVDTGLAAGDRVVS